jgi:hypothetical protein
MSAVPRPGKSGLLVSDDEPPVHALVRAHILPQRVDHFDRPSVPRFPKCAAEWHAPIRIAEKIWNFFRIALIRMPIPLDQRSVGRTRRSVD